jgi:hypothetical protein
MAITFLEPGGDATFNVANKTSGGFWDVFNSGPTIVTDIVHGNHIKSIKSGTSGSFSKDGLFDGGSDNYIGRISIYFYFVSFPSTTSTFIYLTGLTVRITNVGVLQVYDATNAQVGSNGATLSTGQWYRLSIAFNSDQISDEWQFKLYVDGVQSISINETSNAPGLTTLQIGNSSSNASFDFRVSDIYVDNLATLTDTGDVWVTAKRPNANGTTNGFTTQIGAGGSGYGSGHSPQVNERALSTTNGWSMVGAGSAVTEEYNIESKSTGDIDISTATIVDWIGWAYMKSLVGETVQMILDGENFAQAITSSDTMYTKVKGSTTYPSGTGADIGITTDTSLTTVSLYECGAIVAYIPGTASPSWNVVIS